MLGQRKYKQESCSYELGYALLNELMPKVEGEK